MGCRLKPKLPLVSETAAEVAGGAPVVVLHVSLRVDALRAVVVPAT